MCWVDNEDVVGAAPTGDAPTTSEWSTRLLYVKVCPVFDGLTVYNNAYHGYGILEMTTQSIFRTDRLAIL